MTFTNHGYHSERRAQKKKTCHRTLLATALPKPMVRLADCLIRDGHCYAELLMGDKMGKELEVEVEMEMEMGIEIVPRL